MNPPGGAQPHQALAAVIHQLANPTGGEPPADQHLIHMAQALQTQMLAKCSIEEKHRRLQSVVSKLEHNHKLLAKSQEKEAKLQEELHSLQEERRALAKKNEDLELERQELLNVVNVHMADPKPTAKPDVELTSGSEADSESSESKPPAKRSKSQSKTSRRDLRQAEWLRTRPPPLQPAAGQWETDLANMDPQVFAHLNHLMQAEATRRGQVPPPEAATHQGGREGDTSTGFGEFSGSHTG